MKTIRKKNGDKRGGGKVALDRKSAREETKRAAQRKRPCRDSKKETLDWKQIFDCRTDSAFVTDKDYSIVMVNQSLARHLGVSKRSLLGKKCYKIFHGMNSPYPHCIKSSCTQHHGPKSLDIYDPCHDKYFEFAGYPLLKNKKKKREVECLLHTIKDITERKKTENALTESERKLRVIFDSTSDGMLVADIESMKFLAGNRAICTMLGYTENEIKKLDIMDIHPTESLPYVLSQFKMQVKGEKSIALNIPVITKKGDVFYVDINAGKIDFEGKSCLIETFRDKTERKIAEELLKESRKEYKNIVDNSLVGIFKTTLQGKVIFANQAMMDILEYDSSEEFNKRNIAAHYRDPNDREAMLDILRNEGKVINYEVDAITCKGNEKTVILNSFLEGDVISGLVLDITERKIAENKLKEITDELEMRVKERTAEIVKANKQLLVEIYERKKIEEELRESEKRFREVAASTTDLIWEGDVRCNVLNWFGDIDGKLGYAPGEFPRTISGHMEAVHPDDRDILMKSIEKVLDTGDNFFAEYRIRCKDGTYRYWDERGKATGFEDGKAVKWAGSVTDITGKKETEEELLKSEERYRTIFNEAGFGIANVSSKGKFLTVNKKLCEMFGYD
ncbi:MAG: PAS domain S-box protein [Nitrospiraceae bacterium]|nr:MAG: PAS domain S-box protein [Nitrospiraceae bacterium]